MLYGASVVLFFVTSRYIMPMFPALAVLVSIALVKIISFLKGRRRKMLAASLFLLAVFALLSNAELIKWNDRPLRSGMRYNLGVAMMEKGRFEQAVDPLEQAVEIKPSWPEANLALANALALSGKPQQSIRYYQAALFYGEKFAEAHYDFGLTLIKLRRPEEAYGHLSSAHQLKPELFPTPEQVLNDLSKQPAK
jgi:Tfp pilus assembly protein PilF